MSYVIIIILGMLQGACEFLPVSSSGHLVVFYQFFNITQNTILLSVILHLATLGSVVFVYYKQLWNLVIHPFNKTNLLLLVATVPTVAMVLLFKKFIEESFSGNLVLWCFLATAVLLFAAEQISKKVVNRQKSNVVCTTDKQFLTKSNHYNFSMNWKQAFFVGVMQGVATLPGISRSGATISAGLMAGVPKEEVADFSFLLSVPIILASLAYELFKLNGQSAVLEFSVWQLFVGFCVAFLVGTLCLRSMIGFVKKQKLTYFSVYLVSLVLFLLLNQFVFHWL